MVCVDKNLMQISPSHHLTTSSSHHLLVYSYR